MSQNAQRDMSGILFKNNRKEKDSHPDYTGTATIDGTEYWMSAWLKDGQKGRFMSFAFTPKEQQHHVGNGVPRATARPTARPLREELDDEIPF